MHPEDAPTLSIPTSKGKTAFIALGAFAFALGGLAMCCIGLMGPLNFGVGIGALSALFFGPIGVFALRKLFDSRPALVIDAEGIIDNSSAVSAGRILWSEITAITASEVVGQRFVNVHVVDPARFLAQGNAIQRFLRGQNMKMVGTPITISSNGLPLSFGDLHSLFVRALDTYKQA